MSRLARFTLFSGLAVASLTVAFTIMAFVFSDFPDALGVAMYLAVGISIWALAIGCLLLIVRALFRRTRRLAGRFRG
jgi:hypothetical protein